jgi:hypothetical protein
VFGGSSITPKEQLAAFAPIEPKSGPNYMPESVMQMLEAEGFSREDVKRSVQQCWEFSRANWAGSMFIQTHRNCFGPPFVPIVWLWVNRRNPVHGRTYLEPLNENSGHSASE